MTVEVYLGKKFEHSHERRALAWFLKDMLAGFGDGDTLYQVIVETKIDSADIDLLLISSTAIVIVEFKAFVHAEESEAQQIHVVGKLNDSWQYVLPNGREYTIGDPAKHKNPYRQTRGMRYDLANWLATNSQAILGRTWIKEDALEHLCAWVVVLPGFDGDTSDIALPLDELTFHRTPARWFQILPIARLAAEFDCAPDTGLRLTAEQRGQLISQLGVARCDNLQELVPGYAAPAPLFSKPPELETLIDREPQREALLNALANPAQSIIVIQGLAGVGRTAVAAWLVAEANRRNYRTRWIDCRDRANLTLDAFLVAISAEITDLKRTLLRDPDQPLRDRLDAALEFLAARSTLLVFDDYHLLTHRAAVDQFVERATRYHAGLSVMLTARERLADAPWPADTVCEVELDNLSLEAFRDFVNIPAHHVDLDPADIQMVWQRLSGNPQAFLLSRSTVRRMGLMGQLDQLPVIDSEEQGKSLLGNVSAEAQALAQRLVVLRTRFTFQTVVTLSQTSPEHASEWLLELVDKYWLQPQPTHEFVMIAIIRTALYSRMTDKVRRDAHLKAGEHYAALADGATTNQQKTEYLIETIYHVQQGGPRKQLLKRADELISLLTKAGDREQAYTVAVAALTIARDESDREKLCYWLTKTSRLELDMDHRAQSGQLLDEAVACLPASVKKLTAEQAQSWQKLAAQIEYMRGRLAYRERDYHKAQGQLKRALQLAQDSGDDATAATCFTLLGSIARRRGDLDEAAMLGNEGLTIARHLSDQKLMAENLGHTGLAERSRTHYDNAKWLFGRAYEISSAINDAPAAEILLGHLGRTTMLAGDNEEAERIFRRALRMAQELHTSIGIRVQLSNLAEVLIRQARYAEAEPVVAESERRNKEANDQIGLAWNLKHRGQIAKARGQVDHGNSLIRQGLEWLLKIDDKEYVAEFELALRQEFQLPLGFDQT